MGDSGPRDGITQDGVMKLLRQQASPLSTEEVCKSFGCSCQAAQRHLETLAEREQIQRKQVSESNAVWWVTDRNLQGDNQNVDEQLSAFVSAVEDYAVFVLRPDGTVATWNEGAEQIKGYGEDEIVGDHFSTFYTDEDVAEGVPERNLETAATEGQVEDEGWRVRKDGSRFWANVTITATRDEDGELRGFTKVTRDMTERREYEQQLEAQNEQLERQRDELEEELEDVFERVDDAFYALDEKLRFEYVNERAEELFGKSAGELLGQAPWEALDADEDDPIFAKYETALESQESRSFERCSEPLGIWEEVRVYPSESGLSVYFRDVTDQKKRERALRESEERYRSLTDDVLDTSEVGTFILDSEFEIVWVNEAVEEYFDLDREAILGRDKREVIEDHIAELFEKPQEFANRVTATYDDNTYTEQFECHIVENKTRDERWLEHWSQPIQSGLYAGGRIEHYTNITQQKQRERELSWFKRAVEASGHAIYMTDADGEITYVNSAFEEITGYSAEEAIGKSPEILQSGEHDDTYYQTLWETVQDGDVWEEEITDRQKNGERYYAEQTIAPVTGENGEIDRFVAVQNDITERKRHEQRLEELIERLDASNERLEQFAYAVSHDLQEPLRMVSSYLQLIERRFEDDLDEEALEYLDFAVDGAERMTEMIDDLLEYSRIETQGSPTELVDLDAVLEDARADLQFRIEEHDAEIMIEELPEVKGDESQLRQLFQNLLDNAIEYSGEEPPRVHISAAQEGSTWQISVRDEGIGIDPEDQERIFEIFQRLHTREEHEGTGVGLALCERIVDHHGGEIQVESEAGAGTTFTISLPAVDST
ncbi:PAS domain S-box-containing protein [Halobiforma haloterrestris]|uniref:histidine kinase n=1 Tax=Natronobacterium haloterrestre TaxID=148448 RepID=A0A1I1LW39_NATHA|nr:PAS domain S-box-containing protein [Halobiforma haloterrestris]